LKTAWSKIPNRFQLVLAATYRARMLSQGHTPRVESKNKPGVTALREIAAGKVGLEMLKKVPACKFSLHSAKSQTCLRCFIAGVSAIQPSQPSRYI